MRKIFCIILSLVFIFTSMTAFADGGVRVPILLYHQIAEQYDIKNALINITPQMLEEHLNTLKNAGYNTITFDDYYNYVNGKGTLPSNPIIISFDDGYESNYIYAYPALKSRGMKATIFIITNSVGKTEGVIPHFTWEQAKEMNDSGVIDIESHTNTHRDLSTLTPLEVKMELRLSKFLIEKNLNKKCYYLAYPYGLFVNSIFTEGLSAGYRLQSKVGDFGYNDKDSWGEPLKRITVPGTTTSEQLINLITTNLK